jgi:hypothetical protein
MSIELNQFDDTGHNLERIVCPTLLLRMIAKGITPKIGRGFLNWGGRSPGFPSRAIKLRDIPLFPLGKALGKNAAGFLSTRPHDIII